VIVIDGVDELEGNDYYWLPRQIPAGVRVILSARETGDIASKRRPVIKKRFDASEKPKPGPDGRYPCKRCGRKINSETGAKTTEWATSCLTGEALEAHIESSHKAVGSELMIDIIPLEEEVAALRLDPLGSKSLKVSLGALLKNHNLFLPPSCEQRLLAFNMTKVPLFLNLSVGYLTLFECCHSVRQGMGGLGDLDDEVAQDLVSQVEAVVASVLGKGLPSLIEASLERLGEAIPMGHEAIRDLLALLAASRYGLAEADIAALVGSEGCHALATFRAAGWLLPRCGRWVFSHSEVRKRAAKGRTWRHHHRIAVHLGRSWREGTEPPSKRSMQELPWQLHRVCLDPITVEKQELARAVERAEASQAEQAKEGLEPSANKQKRDEMAANYDALEKAEGVIKAACDAQQQAAQALAGCLRNRAFHSGMIKERPCELYTYWRFLKRAKFVPSVAVHFDPWLMEATLTLSSLSP